MPVTVDCYGNPKLVTNSLYLTTKVNTSVSGDILLRNEGDANLNIASITGVTTTSPLAGAKLEIISNPAPVAITPNSGWTVDIQGTCGDISGTLSGYITVSSNDITNPVAQVPVSLQCTEDIKLSGPASAKFFSSNPSWSEPGNLSIPIQNLSRVSVAYTATLTGLPRVNIIGGATGSIPAIGSTQINLEGVCPETFFPSGATAGTLNVLVDGVLITSIPVRFVCVGVEHAAYVSGLDCGARASVRTSKPSPGLSYLVSGYSNLITVLGPCSGPSTASADALVQGKADADAHIPPSVPAEQWEMPCRNAEAVGGLPLSCRREQWANAKARIEAVGY